MPRPLLAILLICLPARGADPALDALRALLMPMRAEKVEAYKSRAGATARLTEVKHTLRDWVESRIKGIDRSGETAVLALELNKELAAAGFTCGWDVKDAKCPDWSFLGYLGTIDFRRVGGLLVLTTEAGIECGFDGSAYLYDWSDAHGWTRIWQNEQLVYTKELYKPENIELVDAWPGRMPNEFLVMILGNQPWCSSNLRDIYYRIFRTNTSSEGVTIVNGAEAAFASDPIFGALSDDDALIQFSISEGGFIRKAVRHYRIAGDTATRIDPLALSPADFVKEWITGDWKKEAAGWSERTGVQTLTAWRTKSQKEYDAAGDMETKHCPTSPDLWQVSVRTDDSHPTAYFQVRWRPPYRFKMVSVSGKPNPGCTEAGPDAEDDRRTLFPR